MRWLRLCKPVSYLVLIHLVTVSCSYCMASHGTIIGKNEMDGVGSDCGLIWGSSQEQNHENAQNSRSLGKDSNRTSPPNVRSVTAWTACQSPAGLDVHIWTLHIGRYEAIHSLHTPQYQSVFLPTTDHEMIPLRGWACLALCGGTAGYWTGTGSIDRLFYYYTQAQNITHFV